MNNYSVFKSAMVMAVICVISGCEGADSSTYPVTPKEARKARIGKLTSDEGITLLGGSEKKKQAAGIGGAAAANQFLWRAALETISFMPVQSVDAIGGVIITDWYKDPATQGQRIKMNIMVLSSELRSDAISVRTFKQTKAPKGDWKDAVVDAKVNRQLEDTILSKARELKVKSQN